MPSKEGTQDIPVQRVNPRIMQLTDSAHSLSDALQSLQRTENYYFPIPFSQKYNLAIVHMESVELEVD